MRNRPWFDRLLAASVIVVALGSACWDASDNGTNVWPRIVKDSGPAPSADWSLAVTVGAFLLGAALLVWEFRAQLLPIVRRFKLRRERQEEERPLATVHRMPVRTGR